MAEDTDRQLFRCVSDMIYGENIGTLFDGTIPPGICDRNKADDFAIYWVQNIWDGKTSPDDLRTRAAARDIFTEWNHWNNWLL